MQFATQFATPQIWLRRRTEAEKFAISDLRLSRSFLVPSLDGCLSAVGERPSEQERDRPGQTQLASREHLC